MYCDFEQNGYLCKTHSHSVVDSFFIKFIQNIGQRDPERFLCLWVITQKLFCAQSKTEFKSTYI